MSLIPSINPFNWFGTNSVNDDLAKAEADMQQSINEMNAAINAINIAPLNVQPGSINIIPSGNGHGSTGQAIGNGGLSQYTSSSWGQLMHQTYGSTFTIKNPSWREGHGLSKLRDKASTLVHTAMVTPGWFGQTTASITPYAAPGQPEMERLIAPHFTRKWSWAAALAYDWPRPQEEDM